MRAFPWMMALAISAVVFASSAEAQVVGRTVYYAAPAVQTVPVATTTVYRPLLRPRRAVVTTTVPTVYAPQPVVVARPTIPVTPVVRAPVVTTRYRPILGGTVTRRWYP